MHSFGEDELDMLVSAAIRRAEFLQESQPRLARDAWLEVMEYERRLAAITSAKDLAGGIARAGAVSAALSAERREEARRLAGEYLADPDLPQERRAAIARLLEEDQRRLAARYPALASLGRLGDLEFWQRQPSAFRAA